MEGHNPTLREWVTEKAEVPSTETLNDATAARRDAFREVLSWLDENRVDVDPGFAQWYENQMTLAKGVYLDVIRALELEGHMAEITQTGGMCLAITWPASDGSGDYFLLTDRDDVLSWERRESDGWTLGRYRDDGEDCYAVETSDLKHAATAVLMANHAYAGGRP